MATIRFHPSIFMGIDELERKLGLSNGFFDALLKEDDWSFVIKLHALIEAVCTHLLVYHFREDAIKEVVAKLELSNRTTGKITFLKALGLLGEDERRYIYSLSELRNKLVHDIQQSSFKLSEMVATLNDKDLKVFTKAFSPRECKTLRTDLKEILQKETKEPSSLFVEADARTMKELIERARSDPKIHIWAGAHNALTAICDMYGYSTYKQEVKANEILGGSEEEI